MEDNDLVMFDAPIPGSSLTRSPEDSYTWEQPPVITDASEAARFFFGQLLQPKVYNAVLDAVEAGTPLMDISEMLMFGSKLQTIFQVLEKQRHLPTYKVDLA